MCFRKFWDPKMFKNRPPDRLWGNFLYLTTSKNHARLTGTLRIVRPKSTRKFSRVGGRGETYWIHCRASLLKLRSAWNDNISAHPRPRRCCSAAQRATMTRKWTLYACQCNACSQVLSHCWYSCSDQRRCLGNFSISYWIPTKHFCTKDADGGLVNPIENKNIHQ